MKLGLYMGMGGLACTASRMLRICGKLWMGLDVDLKVQKLRYMKEIPIEH